jgi:hypothetical protein
VTWKGEWNKLKNWWNGLWGSSTPPATPSAHPIQKPQVSTPKPNEPNVLPQSINPKVVNPPKPDQSYVDGRGRYSIKANGDTILDENFIPDVMRGIDSLHFKSGR